MSAFQFTVNQSKPEKKVLGIFQVFDSNKQYILITGLLWSIFEAKTLLNRLLSHAKGEGKQKKKKDVGKYLR